MADGGFVMTGKANRVLDVARTALVALEKIEDFIVQISDDDAGRTINGLFGSLDLDSEAHFAEFRGAGVRVTRKSETLLVVATETGLEIFIEAKTRIGVKVPKMGLG